MNDNASGMLGILNRAGLTSFGPGMEKSLRKGHLLLLAKDASPRTLKELETKAEALGLPIEWVKSKEELGTPLGRDELSAVLILSKKGALSLRQKLQKGESK
ncbi:MAG: hypothetical protein E7182_02795 [Erysipelotrichaceae bacterium]|nr:hypothetical protein [Erysipelotrichaceae bacterium]